MKFLVDIDDSSMQKYTEICRLVHKIRFDPEHSLKCLLEDHLKVNAVLPLEPDDRITCRPLEEL